MVGPIETSNVPTVGSYPAGRQFPRVDRHMNCAFRRVIDPFRHNTADPAPRQSVNPQPTEYTPSVSILRSTVMVL